VRRGLYGIKKRKGLREKTNTLKEGGGALLKGKKESKNTKNREKNLAKKEKLLSQKKEKNLKRKTSKPGKHIISIRNFKTSLGFAIHRNETPLEDISKRGNYRLGNVVV